MEETIRMQILACFVSLFYNLNKFQNFKNVTRFAKTQHNDSYLEIQIFASMNSIYLKLCSVVISMLYCKYFLSYKAR